MVKLIIDTDLGCDCDDAGALAVANILHNRGAAEVLAVTHTLPDPAGAICIERINGYYGNRFPIGLSKTANVDVERYFKRFAYPMAQGRKPPPTGESVEVMARTLARSPSKVTVVGIGAFNNVAALLQNYPDLARDKLERLVLMGGCFPDDERPRLAEFNVTCDIAAAQAVCALSPVETVFCDYYHGDDVQTGLSLAEGNPVREAYRLCELTTRSSWDLIAVLFAAQPRNPLFRLTPFGTVTVDDEGITRFTEGRGKHRLLRYAAEKAAVGRYIEDILTDQKENVYEKIV